jgi:hypothetical protein
MFDVPVHDPHLLQIGEPLEQLHSHQLHYLLTLCRLHYLYQAASLDELHYYVYIRLIFENVEHLHYVRGFASL